MLQNNMMHTCTASLTTIAITSAGDKAREPAMNAMASQQQMKTEKRIGDGEKEIVPKSSRQRWIGQHQSPQSVMNSGMTMTATVAASTIAWVTTQYTKLDAGQTCGSTRAARLAVVLGGRDELAGACDIYIFTPTH